MSPPLTWSKGSIAATLYADIEKSLERERDASATRELVKRWVGRITVYNCTELVSELCDYAPHDARRLACAEESAERLKLGIVLL